MFFGGIDIGASATKAALIDDSGRLLGSAVLRSGVDFTGSAAKGMEMALAQAGLEAGQVEGVFACGYGRKNAAMAQETRTEIACHAAGAYHHFPQALTVVDIGGQDNKIIKLNAQGLRTSFKMNRKCAAGTGAFLEEMALRLDLPLESLNGLAEKATEEATLGAFCTVFTATEVLSKIRDGVKIEALVKGLFRSVVKRVMEMDIFEGTVIMTGGVAAHNPYLAEMLSLELGREVLLPPLPQLNGAWGAAILARDFRARQLASE
ncbi:MAG: ATPase [Proteobacteria bacterium]|nr:ATPase [Pseudomonadota bacterium]MBU4385193.1 ATPase [Pseudomonadota bacterium]MBU4603692.1 ATPase [Pseudomonadota bacterium]MCG2764800.1 acyl-CoA dehydratase activase [Desulfarculaceae bacterium]